jgi:hypothetical protein
MVAAIIAKKKKYIRAFRNANALSSQQAIGVNDLGIRKGPIFSKLLKEGVIREADNERFYLDEGTEREVTTRRRKTVSIILFVILLALAIVFGVLR